MTTCFHLRFSSASSTSTHGAFVCSTTKIVSHNRRVNRLQQPSIRFTLRVNVSSHTGDSPQFNVIFVASKF